MSLESCVIPPCKLFALIYNFGTHPKCWKKITRVSPWMEGYEIIDSCALDSHASCQVAVHEQGIAQWNLCGPFWSMHVKKSLGRTAQIILFVCHHLVASGAYSTKAFSSLPFHPSFPHLFFWLLFVPMYGWYEHVRYLLTVLLILKAWGNARSASNVAINEMLSVCLYIAFSCCLLTITCLEKEEEV